MKKIIAITAFFIASLSASAQYNTLHIETDSSGAAVLVNRITSPITSGMLQKELAQIDKAIEELFIRKRQIMEALVEVKAIEDKNKKDKK